MYQFLTKNGQLLAFLLGFVVILVFALSVFSGIDGFNALPDDDKDTTTIFNNGILLTAILFGLCVLAMLFFVIYHMVTNPKGAMKGIIGIVVLAVVFFALYSTSVAETTGPIAGAIQKFEKIPGEFSENTSKMVSAGIKTTLIMGGLAVLAFVGSEIRNLFK